MQKTQNLPPELAGKVVNIADIRAQRIGSEQLSEVIAAQEAGEIASDMSMTEKVWWRNQQFFANRMARSRDFGRLSFKAGHVDGNPAVYVDCEAYAAYMALKPDLTFDLEIDPLLVRWSCVGEPEYPLVKASAINFTAEVLE
jgi:hypothetical protein